MVDQGIESRFCWFNEQIDKREKMSKGKDKIVDIGGTEFKGLVVGMENANCSETFK